MTSVNDAASAEAAHHTLATDPDIRVLRRVTPLNEFPLAPASDGPSRFVALH